MTLKKILIIRFSSIGDIVLTTPVIRCLKLQLKDTEIHYLTKRSFKGILEQNPHLSKVHVIDKDVNEVIADLQKENFDHIIDLHNNLRSSEVKIKLRKKSSKFRKLNLQKWLLVNLKINIMPPIHVVDRYLETVKSLGVINDQQGLDYFIPPQDEVDLNALPLTHQNGFVGFVIGAKHFTKQLPVEKIIAICRKLNTPVILLGGKEDRNRGAEIEKAIGNSIYNACGIYNLNQSASLVKQSIRIITHDTGLMHIASALKKEIFSVWGNTVTDFGFSPYLPPSGSRIIEVKGLSCRPCSKIGHDKCPKGHFKCMREIDVDLF
ncbi:MAG: glycosyltransferase family 9 protein [Bacteroidota bacterium]|nr:glycosyltransferase family 9 protein [Bacteroidota bacterium]